MRVGIIGGGRWGCTLGNNISSDENPVTIYCRQEICDELYTAPGRARGAVPAVSVSGCL